ncbi:DUF6318 family protein [Myceligenerans salitolerans]|uniref:DUF6318 domain-containing protein n=1 Tax=Myceligenerans salitolerans TaxID=1230528 RepID=A0ABS3I8V6_9MICO|nr:DUF6318 family protein [Myceligenerans salitolerans]MBO0609456.1 hypothetical protein [Myceligenerans salitolerans]
MAFAAALGGLAGCTANTDAGPSPTTTVAGEPQASSSASASARTPVEKPQRPAAMDREDAKGAAAAAEYFIELYPYIMATGDTAEFEAMSHEACGFCDDALASARANKVAGYTYLGGALSVEVLDIYQQDSLTSLIPIDVRVEQAASSTLDRTGAEIASARHEVNESRVEVAEGGSGWVVVEIAPRPES